MRRDFEGSPKPSTGNGRMQAPVPATNGQLAPPGPNRRLKSSKQRSQVSRSSSESMNKSKGKGKSSKWDSDDDDEAYVTSNDYATPERRKSTVNGNFGRVGEDDAEMYS